MAIEQVIPAPRPPDTIDASPLARRLASLRGVDLTSLLKGGRLLKRDVVPAPRRDPVAAASPIVAPEATPASVRSDIPHVVEPLTDMRQTIARRLAESKRTVPHIYLSVDVRIDALLDLRTRLNASLASRGIKISVNDMAVKALALALIEVPACNVRYADDAILRFTRADICVAMSVPGGLVAPVVVGADIRSLSAIAVETAALAARARAGEPRSQDHRGGTASLSNLGMFGIRAFAAVIDPPQAMILAVGEGAARPVERDGAAEVATVMTITGSFDHRAIDGADAARLLGAFRRIIEAPMEMTT